MKEVDARGLSCPQPVILLKQALADQNYAGMYVLEPAYRFYLDDVPGKLRRAYEFISGLMEG